MLRQPALLVLCAFALSVLCPHSWAEPPQPPPTADTATVTKIIPLQHLNVKEMRLEMLSQQSPFPPAGILHISGDAKNNCMVLTADDPQALAQFEKLIKSLDTPLTPGKAESLLPAPDGAAKPALRTIRLHYISIDRMRTLLDSTKQFIPAGVQDIVGLNGLNALLVKGKDEESIDAFAQLLGLLDRPVKSALIEATFVQVDAKALASLPVQTTLLKKGGKTNAMPFTEEKAQLLVNDKARLQKWLITSHANILSTPRMIVANGSTGSVKLADDGGTSSELTVDQLTIHPDDSITLGLTLGVGLATPQKVKTVTDAQAKTTIREIKKTLKLRIRSGAAMVLLLDPTEGNVPPAPGTIVTLVFVSPTILKDDPTDFGEMRNLPPLF